MNPQQKAMCNLLLESEPPTAAEASGHQVLAESLNLPIALTDFLFRYREDRSEHEAAADVAKRKKASGTELWEAMQEYIKAGGDMFDANN